MRTRSLLAFASVIAACAPRARIAPPLENQVARGPMMLEWRASNPDDKTLDITFAIDGRIVASDGIRDIVVATADQCKAYPDGTNAISFACGTELTSWEAALGSGALVVTRVDTELDGPPQRRDRERQLARIPTSATSFVTIPAPVAPHRSDDDD